MARTYYRVEKTKKVTENKERIRKEEEMKMEQLIKKIEGKSPSEKTKKKEQTEEEKEEVRFNNNRPIKRRKSKSTGSGIFNDIGSSSYRITKRE